VFAVEYPRTSEYTASPGTLIKNAYSQPGAVVVHPAVNVTVGPDTKGPVKFGDRLAFSAGGEFSKIAVQDFEASIVTVIADPAPLQSPDQPAKDEPALGVAVSVTSVFSV